MEPHTGSRQRDHPGQDHWEGKEPGRAEKERAGWWEQSAEEYSGPPPTSPSRPSEEAGA